LCASFPLILYHKRLRQTGHQPKLPNQWLRQYLFREVVTTQTPIGLETFVFWAWDVLLRQTDQQPLRHTDHQPNLLNLPLRQTDQQQNLLT
jgi:hypothetical protein